MGDRRTMAASREKPIGVWCLILIQNVPLNLPQETEVSDSSIFCQYILESKQDYMQNIPGHFQLKMIFLSLGNFKSTQPGFSLSLLGLCIFECQASGSRSFKEQALQENKTTGVLLEEQAVMMTASSQRYETVDTEGVFLHIHD